MSADKKKTEALLVRMSPAEKAHAQAQAEGAGLSLSELVRAQLAGTKIRATADVSILNELRRLGGLVKYAFSQGADPARTSAALRELEAAAARLAR